MLVSQDLIVTDFCGERSNIYLLGVEKHTFTLNNCIMSWKRQCCNPLRKIIMTGQLER